MTAFDWGLHPDAADFEDALVRGFLARHPLARTLAEKIRDETATRFSDWIDHARLPESACSAKDLLALGFEASAAPDGTRGFKHPGSCLFPILLCPDAQTEIALKPEGLTPFIKALGVDAAAEGEPFAPLRKARIARADGHILSAVERRGYDGFAVQDAADTKEYTQALESFLSRKRSFASAEEGMAQTRHLIENSALRLAAPRLCDAFFRAERIHWQANNKAGQAQKARQDRLGMGWGNHDHHTYRSSRENFLPLMHILRALGFSAREKYYAGEQAGWGAQVLEQAACGIVVFADVDLQPQEAGVDFSSVRLRHGRELGTVGLWVGLHGESLLQAGLHHLAGRFDFSRLAAQLEPRGVKVMPPFSDFPFLKQAFTRADLRPVAPERLQGLLANASITPAQGARFQAEGALGSHLESLERNQGFKGFNRNAVTKIILATDPRLRQPAGA